MVEPRSPEQTAAVLTAVPRTATSRRERPRWRRSQRAGEETVDNLAVSSDRYRALQRMRSWPSGHSNLSPESPAAFRAGLFLPGNGLYWCFFTGALNLIANLHDERRLTDTSRWSTTYDNDECEPVLWGFKEQTTPQIHASSHRKDQRNGGAGVEPRGDC